jgi:hypothetical protein
MLYLRLFGSSKPMRQAVGAGIAIISVFNSIYLVLFLSFALPRRGESLMAAGARSKRARDCLVPLQAVCCAGVDVYICALPLPVIWRLQMKARKKAAAHALILTGSL